MLTEYSLWCGLCPCTWTSFYSHHLHACQTFVSLHEMQWVSFFRLSYPQILVVYWTLCALSLVSYEWHQYKVQWQLLHGYWCTLCAFHCNAPELYKYLYKMLHFLVHILATANIQSCTHTCTHTYKHLFCLVCIIIHFPLGHMVFNHNGRSKNLFCCHSGGMQVLFGLSGSQHSSSIDDIVGTEQFRVWLVSLCQIPRPTKIHYKEKII